jgi:hypothetical protein
VYYELLCLLSTNSVAADEKLPHAQYLFTETFTVEISAERIFKRWLP